MLENINREELIMKKIAILFSSIFIFFLTLCGCLQFKVNSGKIVQERTYVNDDIGITFTLESANWRFYSSEEIAEAIHNAKEEAEGRNDKIIFPFDFDVDFIAADDTYGTNVILGWERYGESAEEYAKKFKEQVLESYKEWGYSFEEDSESILGEYAYLRLSAACTVNGNDIKQFMYMRKVEDSIVVVVGTTPFNANSEYFEEMFGAGLTYSLNEDGKSYTLTGANTYIDENLVIPAEYKDLPVTAIGKQAFSEHGFTLKSVTIPDTITRIEREAFRSCYYIQEIAIPDSVVEIEANAFTHCDALKKITMGGGIEKMAGNAFSYCSKLEKIYIQDIKVWCEMEISDSYPVLGSSDYYETPTFNGADFYVNGELAKTLVIPDGVKKIGRYAFLNFDSMESLTIADSVETIGDFAFYDCTSLKRVDFGEGISQIGYGTFENCSEIENLSFPDGLESIGTKTFSGCRLITDLVLPDSVRTVGPIAFQYCTKLKNVTIGKNIEELSGNAFLNCKALEKINIQDIKSWCKK